MPANRSWNNCMLRVLTVKKKIALIYTFHSEVNGFGKIAQFRNKLSFHAIFLSNKKKVSDILWRNFFFRWNCSMRNFNEPFGLFGVFAAYNWIWALYSSSNNILLLHCNQQNVNEKCQFKSPAYYEDFDRITVTTTSWKWVQMRLPVFFFRLIKKFACKFESIGKSRRAILIPLYERFFWCGCAGCF